MESIRLILRDCVVYRKTLILILAPLFFLPLIIGSYVSRETKCAYVVLLMTTYWISECMPLAVTAFLPIFCFPILGVMNVKETCANYLKDTNFLFFGGLVMALATEECHLHRRIALTVLCKMGGKPHWLILGFMLTTAFLSMWMSNVAACAMMVPIVLSMLEEFVHHHRLSQVSSFVTTPSKIDVVHFFNRTGTNNRIESTTQIMNINDDQDSGIKSVMSLSPSEIGFQISIDEIKENIAYNDPTFNEMSVQTDENDPAMKPEHKLELQHELKKMPPHIRGLCKAILLSICYAANLGGTGTLTGTSPNIVLSGQLAEFYPDQQDITFASWLIFAVPLMLICLFFTWIWIMLMFLGVKSFMEIICAKQKDEDGIKEVLEQKRQELGKMKFSERSVLCLFTILVFLWVSREPMFIAGWRQWLGLKKGLTSDACASMLLACVLFIWPTEMPDFIWLRSDPETKPVKRKSLMTWQAMQKKFPWSIIMLLGGGFAMADGIKSSGLDNWIGCSIQQMIGTLPTLGIVSAVVVLVTCITTVASNAATATIFIPILMSLAETLKTNPLLFALPATIACSFSFALPISTPPNAVIYETKMVTLREMIISGTIMTIICVFINAIYVNTFAYNVFDLGSTEKWISSDGGHNSTC